MVAPSDEEWGVEILVKGFPDTDNLEVGDWAIDNVKLVGSVRSERFDPEITPWLKKAYAAVNHPDVSTFTLVMPAQSGKSALGEIVICWWIATKSSGDIQYNWESDDKGKARFKKRVFKILQACKAVADRMPSKQTGATPLIVFPHLNFTMQGVHVTSKLESDSITLQLNEELHDWEEGRKKLADNRLTAVWQSLQGNISTGGKWNDQLHGTWKQSSQEMWEEPCDKCGEFQHWHAKAVDEKLGGLKYETIKKDDGTYDFDAIAKTIYYECEHCGHKHFDDYEARRQRAMKGDYPNPEFSDHIGLHMEQVSVYWIPYIKIVQEKLEALQSLRRGDKQPWITYIQRSEGWFYDPRYRPHIQNIGTANQARMKQGLKNRDLRGMTVDHQRGRISLGETPYYWVVIRDWASPTESMLVWEGRLEISEQVESLREEYGVEPRFVLVDSGFSANEVYRICARYGYVAIKGDPGSRELIPHRVNGETIYRIYSPIKMIEPWQGAEAEGVMIPFLLYSKAAIRDRLESIREVSGDGWGVPDDVSDTYKEHMVSEEKEEQEQKDGSSKMVWIQHAKRNDLFVCECYQVILVDLFEFDEQPKEVKETENSLTNPSHIVDMDSVNDLLSTTKDGGRNRIRT